MATNIIPSDDLSVFDVLTALQGTNPEMVIAIVRPNNPPPGVGGFVFDYTGEEITEIESSITDNFIEDNTTIQDQISLMPEKVTVRAIVAELVTAPEAQAPQSAVPAPLPLNPGLVPNTTTQPETVQPTPDAQSLYQYYENKSVISPAPGVSGAQGVAKKTRQTDAFLYFYNLWKGRQLCTVETPYGIWTNMAILTGRFSQPEETKGHSDFWITFKKIKFAQDLTVNLGQLSGRAAYQRATTTQKGNAGETPLAPAATGSVINSWLRQAFGP